MLELKKLSFSYIHNGKKISALQDIDFSIEKGDFVSIVGSSGAGKTTLLKLIAGLLQPTQGEILFNDKKITAPSRDRGLVFQQFSLFPWLTVKENVAFGLKLKNYFDKDWKEKTNQILTDFGLVNFAESYPKNLSGGMQQRVAIARTMVINPEIILMDEPFGSLDAQTRSKMQEFLAGVYEKTKKTIIFVTHDIEESIFLADRVLVVSNGGIQEIVVDLPRPRKLSAKYSNDFQACVSKVRALIL